MHELRIVDAAELAAAYAAAHYSVALEGDVLPLRVGEPAADLEAYWPAERYAFITAWNPATRPPSGGANQAADASLVAQLDAIGARRQPAWAEDSAGDWREPGWVVADLDLATLDLLAREFGQAGVLAWQRGEPVRLRMLLEQPVERALPGAETPACCIDWVE